MQTSHFTPRQFLPETIDLTDTAQLAPVFDKLTAQARSGRDPSPTSRRGCAITARSAPRWPSRRRSPISQMTCQTDDEAKEKAYMHIVEVVDPWLKPRQFALMQKLAASPFFPQLPPFYEVYRRSVETQVKIYREENVARETAGREAHAAVPENQRRHDRAVRRPGTDARADGPHPGRARPPAARSRLETVVAERRLQDADKLEELFDQLLVLRNEIAHAAGFSDFRAYTFANYERFDYTPDDCLRFHDAVEHHVVPLARELQEERRKKLGLDKLRPWDLAVDPDHNPPLHPFNESSELLEKCHQIFAGSTRGWASIITSCARRNSSISTTARARRRAATRARFPRRACPSSS